MPRLFLELNVLADFDAGAQAVLGMLPKEFQELNGAAVMWKMLEATPEFYARLAWMHDGRALWDAVTDKAIWPGPAPMVLSGLPLGNWAQQQKREWCSRELGLGVPVILCMSIDKHHYASAGDILIDDRDSARLDWVTAGGRFILFKSASDAIAQLKAMI